MSYETTHTVGGGSTHLHPLLACSLLPFAIGSPPQFVAGQTSGPERTGSAVIVELFTPEGCSSCPPADAMLRQINLKQTGAGQLIVGISEHVTYWNDLGWKDPLFIFGIHQTDQKCLRLRHVTGAPTHHRWL